MNAQKSKAVLSLGSNSGDRIRAIDDASRKMEEFAGNIILHSSLYETSPWGFSDQPDFLNKVVVIETFLQPLKLLQELKKIEKKLGRTSSEKWQQRIIDIDILFYNEIVFESEALIIPHPLMHKRNFTLIPLIEIAPDFIHPVLKKKMTELIHECEDSCTVKKIIIDFLKE